MITDAMIKKYSLSDEQGFITWLNLSKNRRKKYRDVTEGFLAYKRHKRYVEKQREWGWECPLCKWWEYEEVYKMQSGDNVCRHCGKSYMKDFKRIEVK